MKLVYFSWIRERIGVPEEEVVPPPGVENVSGLLSWLRTRGDEYAAALEHDSAVRVAINQEHVPDRHASIAEAREIALFPPMTGG
jgi:molybdopterin synthase sulfur carrier subunit